MTERFDEAGARFMVGGKLVDHEGKPVDGPPQEEPKKPAKKEAAKEAE